MFERYTESARRTIFFGRYEASQFGSPYIESEHLLLGLFRTDKALAKQYLPDNGFAHIQRSITQRSEVRTKIATSVDLPLSHECKRILAYAAEESQRLGHVHIGTAHLLLGLLREDESFAAQLLREQGLTADDVRQEVGRSEPSPAGIQSASPPGLDRWLADVEAHGSVRVVQRRSAENRSHFALYAVEPSEENEGEQETGPAKELREIRKRIDRIVQHLETAIVSHEFEKARRYSEEESKEREKMRRLREQFQLEEPAPQAPVVCIEVIGGDTLPVIRKRCDVYIAQGAAEVWLLDAGDRRAYTVTKIQGLREFKEKILRIAQPPLEMEVAKILGSPGPRLTVG